MEDHFFGLVYILFILIITLHTQTKQKPNGKYDFKGEQPSQLSFQKIIEGHSKLHGTVWLGPPPNLTSLEGRP